MTSRKEVAEKLREAGERLDKEAPSNLTIAAYTTLFELLESAGIREGNSYSDVFNRLADLIDITCKNKQVETNKMAPVEFKADNFICSSCGETFCADKEGVNAPIDWSYCPACGARVVRDA